MVKDDSFKRRCFGYNFRRGRQHGMTTKYFKTGEIQSESEYLDGQLHGWSRVYHKTGVVIIENFYEYGKIVPRKRERKTKKRDVNQAEEEEE